MKFKAAIGVMQMVLIMSSLSFPLYSLHSFPFPELSAHFLVE